jgi:teichuronic acid biosynthesis glycosyltransferase TuaG
MSSKVSVIIPFYYTRIDWLTASIESVLNQTYKNIEIILVNDGSDADLTEFLAAYGDKIKYFKKKNGGSGSARNLGMEVAEGDYVAFQDADDLWDERKLELQVALMDKTGAVWSHSNYILFHDTSGNSEESLIDVAGFRGDVFQKCLLSSPIGLPTVMIRNDFLKSHPDLRFSDDFRFGEDNQFWMRIAELGNKLEVIEKPLAKVRVHGSNKAHNTRLQVQVRSLLWRYAQTRKDFYFGKGKFNRVIRTLYRVCDRSNRILEKMERAQNKSNERIELMSKVFYVIPYIIFKVYYRILITNSK